MLGEKQSLTTKLILPLTEFMKQKRKQTPSVKKVLVPCRKRVLLLKKNGKEYELRDAYKQTSRRLMRTWAIVTCIM